MVWNSLQTFPEALLGFSGLDSKPKILHVLFMLACHIQITLAMVKTFYEKNK